MTRPQLTESGRFGWDRQFARTDAWTGTTSRRCVDLLVMLGIAAAVVDGAITYVALAVSNHVERNPLMRAAFEQVGLVPVLVVGLALRVAILVCLAYIAVRAPASGDPVGRRGHHRRGRGLVVRRRLRQRGRRSAGPERHELSHPGRRFGP